MNALIRSCSVKVRRLRSAQNPTSTEQGLGANVFIPTSRTHGLFRNLFMPKQPIYAETTPV